MFSTEIVRVIFNYSSHFEYMTLFIILISTATCSMEVCSRVHIVNKKANELVVYI